MKKSLTLSFFLLIIVALFAQQSEKALGSVKYLLLHQRDTLSSDYYQEFMGLVFSSNSSVYFSLNKQFRDSVMKTQFEEQMSKNPDNMKIDMRSAPGVTLGSYYSFYQQDKAVMERPLMQVNYVFDAPLPKINWRLTDDKKEIGTYNCRKATGFFSGRQYEAWYCPDIPVSAGPWRLSGLPGLILEANDTTQQVKFVFQSYSTKDFFEHETIAVPANAEKITKAKFEKAADAMRQNPEEFMKMVLPNGGTFKVTKITPAPGNLFNNPMELPEKKL